MNDFTLYNENSKIFGNNAWGFKIDNNSATISYVNNSNTIKIISIDNNKELYCLRNHKNCILTYNINHKYIISLGYDKIINVYNKNTAKLLHKIKNIKGTFVPTYPCIIKQSNEHENVIFYTSNDGVFMVKYT